MQNHIPLPVIENSSRSHRLVRSVEDMTAAGRLPASASGRHSIVNSTTVSNETALQAKDSDNRPLVYQKNVTGRLQDGPRAQQIASNGGGAASVCNGSYALASDVGQSLGQRSLGHSGSGSKASSAPCGPCGGFTTNPPVILDNPAPPIPATNQSAHTVSIDPALAAEGARLVGAMWHAEYLRLENAAAAASEELRTARRLLDRKRPPVGAQVAYDAALDKARETGAARWNFEMAATLGADAPKSDPRDPDPTRIGIFRDHNCWKCGSGEKPCVVGNPNQCGFPHARND